MKLAELERHLRQHGCALYREGAAHSIWFNPALHKIASVPRHREIKEGTVRASELRRADPPFAPHPALFRWTAPTYCV
jgi:hypothetical protein